MGWESQEEGYVAAVLRPDGSNEVPVGEIVLVMCDDAADVAAFANFKPSAAPAAAAAAPKAAPTPSPAPPKPVPAAPVTVQNEAPKAGASMLEAMKGKKWTYSTQFGLATKQHTYY